MTDDHNGPEETAGMTEHRLRDRIAQLERSLANALNAAGDDGRTVGEILDQQFAQPPAAPAGDLRERVALAISDPQEILPRELRCDGVREHVTTWQTRAVMAVLDQQPAAEVRDRVPGALMTLASRITQEELSQLGGCAPDDAQRVRDAIYEIARTKTGPVQQPAAEPVGYVVVNEAAIVDGKIPDDWAFDEEPYELTATLAEAVHASEVAGGMGTEILALVPVDGGVVTR